jgi:hypothetical protein
VPGDRPSDGGMPPDEHGRRRDDQGGGGLAEPRTRQEYYVALQRTLAKQQSVTAQRITAEEQAASEKWDEDAAESRGIWGKYLQKWPREERPPIDRPDDPPGTWHGDRDQELDPSDNGQVEAACDRIANREEDRISPRLRAVESQDPNRHLVGFEGRLKGRDRIKEKVYDKMEEFSITAEEAVSDVSDAIRYTFEYRESRYTKSVWADIERLKGQGFEMHKLKNYWSGEEYKGINSQWIDPDTGQRFEVQFHTRISFEGKQLTHDAYKRLRAQPDDELEKPDNELEKMDDELEKMVLKAFQRKVSAEVPLPDGALGIPDYP